MNIELRHLRYFVAVAEARHITRAAAQLGMAQPPLSQQMARLERAVGTPLLIREPRGVRLTDAGASLFEDAQRLLNDAERAVERARGAARGEHGRLRVGMINSAPFHPGITRLIREYRARFPAVALRLEEDTTPELARALSEDRIDVALVRPLIDDWPGLRHETLLHEDTIAAVPESHPLARQKSVTLSDLAREPFVLFPRTVGAGLHDAILRTCLEAGFSPRVVQETSQVTSIVNLVAAGLGISIVPATMQQLRAEGVHFVPIAGPAPKAEMQLIYRGEAASATLSSFLEIARDRRIQK